MPELPEVEAIRRTLGPRLRGRRILRVQVSEPRLRERIGRRFATALAGRTITALNRAGKYLLIVLDNGAIWLVHLGMSGRLLAGVGADSAHVHVRVDLSGGVVLTYRDPRRFGRMKLLAGRPAPPLAALGVDPMALGFDTEYLWRQCRGRRRPIKNLLMDQGIAAGIGNIYANEILYRAGIRPGRRAGRLSRSAVAAVCKATREVLAQAIASGGTSIADYRDGSGRPGRFQRHLAVYGRAGLPCRRCRRSIKRRVLAGRSSFYCPACQH